ncbi:MAG: efflux RND transporter periplasmic adaptor subunit [Kiritimatiellia bacterium]
MFGHIKYWVTKHPILSTLGFLVLGAIGWNLSARPAERNDEPLYTVAQGPLTISVTTTGSVQSKENVILKSELEGNNTIIWVVDEGKTVKAGDLLLEFDASDIDQKRKEQEVTVISAQSAMDIAKEKLDITKDDGDTALIDAKIELELAELDLRKFEEGEMPQKIRECNTDIFLAQEDLNRARDKCEWSRKLAAEKFITETELQTDETATRRAEATLEKSLLSLNVYTNYTIYKERAQLASALRRAKRKVDRTRWQNSANYRQGESDLISKTRAYERATNRLAELEFQLAKSRIFAPTNGIVLYATTLQISRRQWWAQPLRAGATANRRQELIYLPLKSGMIVETLIPESSLNKLVSGMQAVMHIDALPGAVFHGKLTKIALLPDGQSAFLNPDLKLYKCEIAFDASDTRLRSGMSCSIELIREVYEDVLAIPLQCVVRIAGVPYVYLMGPNGFPEPRQITLGLDNNRMVRVIDGLEPGEKILLAPPLPDEKEEKPEDSPEMPENG